MGIGSDLWKQYETLTNNRDWVGATSLFTSDAVYDSPGGRHEGSAAIAAFYQGLEKAAQEAAGDAGFEVQMTTSLAIEDGATVVAEWTTRVATAELSGVAVATVRDGKFAIMRLYYDSPAMGQLFSQISG